MTIDDDDGVQLVLKGLMMTITDSNHKFDLQARVQLNRAKPNIMDMLSVEPISIHTFQKYHHCCDTTEALN